MLKADPYANYAELRPDTASVVWDLGRYKWSDKAVSYTHLNHEICDVIDNYNCSAYYEPSYVIARAYYEGGF